MWMMFRPTNGMRVPIRAVDWMWSGSATNFLLINWQKLSGTNSVNPADYETEIYPVWKSNVTNAHINPPFSY
jgi:hypothetical protein